MGEIRGDRGYEIVGDRGLEVKGICVKIGGGGIGGEKGIDGEVCVEWVGVGVGWDCIGGGVWGIVEDLGMRGRGENMWFFGGVIWSWFLEWRRDEIGVDGGSGKGGIGWEKRRKGRRISDEGGRMIVGNRW